MRSLLTITCCMLLATAAAASSFCGGNGIMILSFTPGPELTRVANADADAAGLVTVEVYAVLDQVAPADGPGGVLLAIGGFECELRIAGAEPLAVEKAVLVPHRDFGQRPTQIWAGVSTTGERVDQGPLTLVRWTVRFQGRPHDVRFDLDPAGLLSCKGLAGCAEAGVSAMYAGAIDVAQEGYIFGAGCAPAVLNPTGDPDLTVAPCTVGFADVGIFKPHAR
ncbi:MAG: hypothetical protein R3D98_08190 [Candidatus Krumholzibacteriia bacterium]